MQTKLTLKMDDQIIAQAKKYAEKSRTSLSRLVAHYLSSLAKGKKKSSPSSTVMGLSGALKGRKAVPLSGYGAYLEGKYLK